MGAVVPEISVKELEVMLRNQSVHLIDCREPDETDHGCLSQAAKIPMQTVPDRLAEIPTDQPIAVICRVGGRSARVAAFLRGQGFEKVYNVTGGMLAWKDQIDPTVSVL